jgi:hypothetical protein
MGDKYIIDLYILKNNNNKGMIKIEKNEKKNIY